MNKADIDRFREEVGPEELDGDEFARLIQIVDENAGHARYTLVLDEFDELSPAKAILVADKALSEDFAGWSNARLAGLRTALQQRNDGLALSDYYAQGPLGRPGQSFVLWQLQHVAKLYINRINERLVLRAVRMEDGK